MFYINFFGRWVAFHQPSATTWINCTDSIRRRQGVRNTMWLFVYEYFHPVQMIGGQSSMWRGTSLTRSPKLCYNHWKMYVCESSDNVVLLYYMNLNWRYKSLISFSYNAKRKRFAIFLYISRMPLFLMTISSSLLIRPRSRFAWTGQRWSRCHHMHWKKIPLYNIVY